MPEACASKEWVLDCRIMIKTAAILGCLTLAAHAGPVSSGKATVDWIADSLGYQPGQPVATALRMVLDDGWHTYWINPGEAGMPMDVRFTLPDGWRAEGPLYPMPIRFQTGGLADFGYEGTVVFPILLHPPVDAVGDVEIQAAFSWLTCDDSACIPGDATLTLALAKGEREATPASGEIAAAMKSIPAPAPASWALDVSRAGDQLLLTLSIPAGIPANRINAFPLTTHIIHPAAKFAWSPAGDAWTARVPMSPYAPETMESLELVIHAPGLDTPVIVTWNADS